MTALALAALCAAPSVAVADEGTAQLLAGNALNGVPQVGYPEWLETVGIDGRGIRVAVVDTGVDATHPDLDDRVVAEVNYDPPNAAGDVDELGHGTHVAGIVAGRPDLGAPTAFRDFAGLLYGAGVAPGAQIVSLNGLALTTTAEGLSNDIGHLLPAFARDAVAQGAFAMNGSFNTGEGPGVGYVESARLADGLVRDADPSAPGEQPLVIVFSAGNSGPDMHSVTAPHEAKNIITVAGSNGQRGGDTEEIGTYSSRGPARDGRIVPTVAAPGSVVASARSKPLGGLCFEPADVSPLHSTCTGTSMAAPHVAGAAALIAQWRQGLDGGRLPSPEAVKALLVNSARDLGKPNVPNGDEGWGRVDLGGLFGVQAPQRIVEDRARVLDNTGERQRLRVVAVDPARPLRVTLAWSDVPGPAVKSEDEAEMKRPALVNDLDLTVRTPDGMLYRGNLFAKGTSSAGTRADRLNNVENVWLPAAGAGRYVIDVLAHALPGDGAPAGDMSDQDYALVVANAAAVVCASRRTISFTVRVGRGARVRRVTAFANGDRRSATAAGRGATRTVRVSLAGLGPGSYAVRAVVALAGGRRVQATRTFRTCAARA